MRKLSYFKVWTLAYRLNGPVRQSSPPEGWVSTSQHQWLYDEVDEDPDSAGGAFLHRILFGDGRVLEVPFGAVKVSESALADSFTVPNPARSAKAGLPTECYTSAAPS